MALSVHNGKPKNLTSVILMPFSCFISSLIYSDITWVVVHISSIQWTQHHSSYIGSYRSFAFQLFHFTIFLKINRKTMRKPINIDDSFMCESHIHLVHYKSENPYPFCCLYLKIFISKILRKIVWWKIRKRRKQSD